VLRGLGDERSPELAGQSRPSGLGSDLEQAPADWPSRVGYSPEFAEIESLIALLVETGVLPPVTMAELGLKSERRSFPAQQPALFRGVLVTFCDLLEIGEPAVLRHPELVGDARMAHLQPPSLLCGPTLLEQSDSVELGFQAGRALALATTGRLAGSVRSGGQLRPYFMAALAMTRGVATPGGTSLRRRGAMPSPRSMHLRAHGIAEVSPATCAQVRSINLTAWPEACGEWPRALAGDVRRSAAGWTRGGR